MISRGTLTKDMLLQTGDSSLGLHTTIYTGTNTEELSLNKTQILFPNFWFFSGYFLRKRYKEQG